MDVCFEGVLLRQGFDMVRMHAGESAHRRSRYVICPRRNLSHIGLGSLRGMVSVRRLIPVLIFLVVFPLVSVEACGTGIKCSCAGSCCCRSIMQPDLETLHSWFDCYDRAPYAYVDLDVEPPAGQFSLLDHLDYVPSERDQGYCGNCWVWAGTGILEVALDVQTGVFDRLSVQYFNSKYNEGTAGNWACCGGWLEYLADFYATEGFEIPWSNTNAAWADWERTCDNETAVPWETISTTPNYTIAQCTAELIETHDVGQETAIANIKNVLAQNRAVWFGFFLPTGEDWDQFRNFWLGQPESAIWSPDYSCGHYWDAGGGGHATLCVGYNDDDPENSYWIIVNSWGTAGGNRPNGIFHLDMNLDYDCYFEDSEGLWYSLYWQTLNVTYSMLALQPVASFTYSPRDPFATETVTFDGSESYSPNGSIVNYVWDFGDNQTCTGQVSEHTYRSSGAYQVTLTVTDDEGANATSTLEVDVKRPTVNVQVRAGTIHFRGETADFHVLVHRLGEPVDANLTATLYHKGELRENLTYLIEHVSTGFYRIPYGIPFNASEGTYSLIAEAEYMSFNGVSFEDFLLSTTLTGWNALLIAVNSTAGTLKTDLGLIDLKLDDINATLVNIEDKIILGGKGGLYLYNGTSFTLIFPVSNYIKPLGVYNNTFYAGTVLDNPPTLYYCNGSAENPADWQVDTAFATILNFSSPFGSIDSFEVYNNKAYVTSRGAVYCYDGIGWSMVKTYSDVYGFLDLEIYNGNMYLATRDQSCRCPLYQGGSGFCGRIIEFNGNYWTTVFNHNYWMYSLKTYGSELYAGTANKIYTYNGTHWKTSFQSKEGAYYAVSFIVFNNTLYAGMGNGYILADPTTEMLEGETTVIQQFPNFLILPLFMITTILATIVHATLVRKD